MNYEVLSYLALGGAVFTTIACIRAELAHDALKHRLKAIGDDYAKQVSTRDEELARLRADNAAMAETLDQHQVNQRILRERLSEAGRKGRAVQLAARRTCCSSQVQTQAA